MSSKVNEIAADWSSQQRKSNQHRYDNDGDVLGESEMTQPTTDGSFSEDDDVGWLGSIGADFRNLAACFKDSTLPVLGGMASLVHRTALTVAAEIAQLEREELTAGAWHCDNDADMESLFLPWEIEQENDISDSSVYVTDDELMDAILALSLKDATFSAPFATSGKPTPEKEHCCFLDEPRILLIRRLLDVDENLAAAHARLSGMYLCWCLPNSRTTTNNTLLLFSN